MTAVDLRSVVDPEVVFMSLRLLSPGIDGAKYRSSAPCRACGDSSDQNGARKRRRLLAAGDSEWNIDTLFSDFHARLGALQAELLAQHAKQRRLHDVAADGSSPHAHAMHTGGHSHSPYFPERSIQVPAVSPAAGSGPHTPIASRNSGVRSVYATNSGGPRPMPMPAGLQEHLEARFGHTSTRRYVASSSSTSISDAQRRYDAALMHQDAVLGRSTIAASSSTSSPIWMPLTSGVVPSAFHFNGSSQRQPTPSASTASIGPSVELMQRSLVAGSASPTASRAHRPSSSSNGPVDREKCVYCDVLYHPNKLSEHFEVHCNLRFVCTCGREYHRFNSLRSHVKDKKCVWNRAAHQPQLDILSCRFNLCYKLSHAELSAKVDEWAALPPGAETEEERVAKAVEAAQLLRQYQPAKRHKRKRSSGDEDKSAGGSGDDEQPPDQAAASSCVSPTTSIVAIPSTQSRSDTLSSRFSQNGTNSSPFDISSGGPRHASPRSGSVGTGEAAEDRSNSSSSSRSSPSSSRSSSRDRSTHTTASTTCESACGSSAANGLPMPTSIAPPVFLHSSNNKTNPGTISSVVNPSGTIPSLSNPSGTFASCGGESVSPSPAKSAASGGSPSKSVATRKPLTLPNAQRICKACDKHFSPTSPCDCVLSNQKRHVCTTCGRGFNLKYALVQHEKTVHTTARPFSCRICNASYKWKRGLVRHYRRTHKQTFGALPRGRPRVSLPGDTEPHPMAADTDTHPPLPDRRQSNPSSTLASLISLGSPHPSAYHGGSLPPALPPTPGNGLLSSRRLSESQLSLFMQRANPYGNTAGLMTQSGGLARHLEMDHIVRNGVATAIQSHAAATASSSHTNTPHVSPATISRSISIMMKIDPDSSPAEAVPGSDAGGGGASRDITPSRTPEPLTSNPPRSRSAPISSAATLPVLESGSAAHGQSGGQSTSSVAPPSRSDIPALERESEDNNSCTSSSTSSTSCALAATPMVEC